MSFASLLLDSESGTEFLARAHASLKESDPAFSYANFARKAGFSARSFAREVFLGKKTLSLKAFPAFAKALGLTREERELFRCLLAVENPGFDPSLPHAMAIRELAIRKKRFSRRSERSRIQTTLPSLNPAGAEKIDLWPRVYAALGGDTRFEAIVQKTKLPALLVERSLRAMEAAGIVRREGDLAFPVSRHLVLDPAIHQSMIQTHFQWVMNSALSQSAENFRSPDQTYFVSSFGIPKGKVPELKKRLIETLLRFVDETEDAESEEIVSLAATMI